MDEFDTPPTLASLRRGFAPRRKALTPPESPGPSLFDLLPGPDRTELPDQPAPAASVTEVSPAPQTHLSQPTAPHPANITLPVRGPDAPPQTWTVTGLIRHVRAVVEKGYCQVTVEGEISNWRPAGSGHCYFTLKDADAQISAVLFRRQAALLRFKPGDGDAVKLHGQLSVYEGRGQLQLIVEWMQQAGLGALLAAVQQLKDRLRREGLFDRKRQLPPFPRCIGIITSLHGAALRDIVKVCRRRHAAVRLLIYPAAVQGPNCPAEITAGIRWFNTHPGHAEVLLVARGGGSWEDLHGFDHEDVACAIAASHLPVITGIGHATDSTVADAAADLCAPTPSAAAEMLTAAQHRVEEQVLRLESRVLRAGRYEFLRAQQRLAHLAADVVLRRVQDQLHRRAQTVDELTFRADSALSQRFRSHLNRLKAAETRVSRQNPVVRLQLGARRLDLLRTRLERAATRSLLLQQRRGDAATTRLQALSPLRVLDRGYALVYGPDGRLLRDAAHAIPGQHITARLARGTIAAEILPGEGPRLPPQ